MKKMRYLAVAICSLLLTSCSNSIPYEELNNFVNEWDTHVLTVNSSYDLSEGTFDYNNKVYSFDSADIDYIHYYIDDNILQKTIGDEESPSDEYILEYTEEQKKQHDYIYDGDIEVKKVEDEVEEEKGYILDGPIVTFLFSGQYNIIADVSFEDGRYVSIDLGYYYVYDPETITYINTIDDFMDINTYGGYYYLNADLDFEGIDFKPLNNGMGRSKYNKFLFINPDNHVIKNITINEVYTEDDSISNWCGIFFYVDGYMDGLIIDNLNITYKYIADIDLGVVGGIAHSCSLNSIFKNCHINGNIEAINCDSVGGLLGMVNMYGANLSFCLPYLFMNCSFTGNIDHTITDNYLVDKIKYISTGGLVGIINRSVENTCFDYERLFKEHIIYPDSNINAHIEGPKYVGGFSGSVTRRNYSDHELKGDESYFDYNFDNFELKGSVVSKNEYDTSDVFGKVFDWSRE